MKKLFLTMVLIAAAAILVLAFAYRDYQKFLAAPINREAEVILLKPGTSFSALVRKLETRGLTDQPFHWRFLGWRMNAGSRIKAGEYRISAGMNPPALLRKIISGEVVQHSFTIVEGSTFAELMMALEAHPVLRQTLNDSTGQAIMAAVGHPNEHPEGRFLPETYYFPRGTSEVDLLQRAHAAMHSMLDDVWPSRARELPLKNPYETLILASIIEKETGLSSERRRIAGVFVRRLKLGMRLQTDPTVIYGLGSQFDGNLTLKHLRTDTPYNTYTRHGLPPTPICMPGVAALKAAVHPAAGDALYFVATGDGGHVFSASLQEHNRAVRRYQLKKSP